MHQADEPLRKVTLNLYASDVAFLKRKFDQGYTEKVREIVREWVEEEPTYTERLK